MCVREQSGFRACACLVRRDEILMEEAKDEATQARRYPTGTHGANISPKILFFERCQQNLPVGFYPVDCRQ